MVMTSEAHIHAVGYTAAGPVSDARSFVSAAIPAPSPGPRDLLVAVRATSVNPVDVKVRARTPPSHGFRVLGFDAAGVVIGVGSAVAGFAVGDEVYYAGALDRPGSNADLQVVDERIVARKPSAFSFADAAALPLTALTAYEGLADKLQLTESSEGTLLMVGGAGGVGSMVIQLVRSLYPGVHVIATASRRESATWVRDLGAHDVVDHHGDVVAQLAQAAPEGVDWIFTTNSHGQLPTYVSVLKPFGQIVAIDDPSHVDVVSLKPKALTWHWEFMFARSLHQAADLDRQGAMLARVAELAESGRIRTTATTVLVGRTADNLREAHRLVESGSVIGKVVLADPAGPAPTL
ncbi:zinc-binding alcohol dehydrogenase family protein [Microbacterium gilvum]|uniref:Zinc-type alcohol dehydrogenase-like protein n=2 Tax=Microbacterium gilvum TaxID=1336204 RepID=A0ABP9AW19_9MICO